MDITPYLQATDLPEEEKDRLRESFRPHSVQKGLSGAMDQEAERSGQSGGQSLMNSTYNYYRPIVDYYGLSWLTTSYSPDAGV